MPSFSAVVAVACINATMAEDVTIKKLREAEAALDAGDVETARALAGEVEVYHDRPGQLGEASGGFAERATRLRALSFVRDPSANQGELDNAVDSLRAHHEYIMSHGDRRPIPPFMADYGEALERDGKDDEAYKLLVPLADRDILGSAYAYAALGRIAERKGDAMHTTMARDRCRVMAVRQSVCRGEYPPRPVLRGRASDFVYPGLVVLAVAIARLARKRPWSTHRARELFGAITVGGWGLFLLANARLGGFAAFVAVVFALVLALLQRRLFFRAAADGNVEGLRLRPLEPGDERAPLVRLFFGPIETQTLEPTLDASYRESARRPLLRVGRRMVLGKAVIMAAVLILILAGVLVGTLTFTRGG